MKYDFFNIVMNRSSYRGRYKNMKVPKDDLLKIMEAGLSAPSGCNKQTVSLIAVDDEQLLSEIKELIDPPICETAPALICVLSEKIYAYRDKCYSVQDYSAAIENMLLVIKSLGYESCWYEGHITDDDNIGLKIADKLNADKGYELVCILPVGYADEEVKLNTDKKPFNERAWFNGFKKL